MDFLLVSDKLGVEDKSYTIQLLRENTNMRWWILGFPFLFLVTEIFNIKATEKLSHRSRVGPFPLYFLFWWQC